MNSLRELQGEFMQAIFSRNESAVTRHIVAGKVDGVSRINIYRRNTFTNLQNALRSVYPVIAKLVGDEFFSYAVTEFSYISPSTSGDLHNFGVEFSEFLRNFSPASHLVYLPEVARLEWVCHTAFFAADHAALDLNLLKKVPGERYGDLVFRLHPACRLLESPIPVDRIWQVNQEGFKDDPSVDLSIGGVKLLIRRPLHHPKIESLSLSEWEFLSSLMSGETLGQACEFALQFKPDFDLAKMLKRRVSDATLVDFSLEQ